MSLATESPRPVAAIRWIAAFLGGACALATLQYAVLHGAAMRQATPASAGTIGWMLVGGLVMGPILATVKAACWAVALVAVLYWLGRLAVPSAAVSAALLAELAREGAVVALMAMHGGERLDVATLIAVTPALVWGMTLGPLLARSALRGEGRWALAGGIAIAGVILRIGLELLRQAVTTP